MNEPSYPRLLALDAATRHVSVACLADGRVTAFRRLAPDRQHSERLLPLVDDLLTEAGWKISELSGIAVTRGPGAFTSVRVALATAQGLALADHLPLFGASTLEILAFAVKASNVVALLDAKKGEVYAGTYRFDGDGLPVALDEECVAPLTDLLPRLPQGAIAIGDGALLHRAALEECGLSVLPQDDGRHAPDARSLAELVFRRLAAGLPCPGPDPAYLRLPEAEVNWRKAREGDKSLST